MTTIKKTLEKSKNIKIKQQQEPEAHIGTHFRVSSPLKILESWKRFLRNLDPYSEVFNSSDPATNKKKTNVTQILKKIKLPDKEVEAVKDERDLADSTNTMY